MLKNLARILNEPFFDGKKYPVVLMNMGGEVVHFITDAKITEELMTTKNKFLAKDPIVYAMGKPLIGNSFIFAPKGDSYNRKRKHISQAFYKNRNRDMQEHLKLILSKRIELWKSEIESSTEKRIVIDIAKEFKHIFAENIISIACGSFDAIDEMVELEVKNPDNPTEYITKRYRLPDAIGIVNNIFVAEMAARMFNPVNSFWRLTGEFYPVTKD